MNELIQAIQTAVTDGATTEQKAAGVVACRTIATALDTEPGKTFTLPGVAPLPVTSRVSIDQVLDLAIARLSAMAKESEAQKPPAPTSSDMTQLAQPQPRALQIPIAATSALRAVPRPAPSRPVQTRARPAANRAATTGRKS